MALNIPNITPKNIFDIYEDTLRRQGMEQENEIKRSAAQYAPYTNYANAASKIAYSNLLPYQIKAQLMSNPLIWMALKDDPKALEAFTKNFKESIPSGNNIFGNVNIPVPGNQQNIFSRLLGNIFGQGQGQAPQQQQQQPIQQLQNQNINAMGAIPSSTSATSVPMTSTSPDNSLLVPAAKGPLQAIAGKQTAGYQEQPYAPGKSVSIDGQTISVPAGSTVGDVQQAYIGIKNALPILTNIANGAEEFLGKGGKWGLKATQVNGLIKQYGGVDFIPEKAKKLLGIDEEKLSRYAKWLSDIQQAPEPLMSAFKLPQNELSLSKVSKIVDPLSGESPKGYKNRILKEMSLLTENRLPLYQSILGSGVLLNPKKETKVLSSLPEGVVQDTRTIDGKKLVKINNQWYRDLR